MLVWIKVINIFCVPILKQLYRVYKKIFWFLAVPKLIIRSDKQSYCLSMTQPNIATSLIEKEPMNTQVRLFLDKFEFIDHFYSEKKLLPNLSLFSYLISGIISLIFCLFPRMQRALIFST